MLTFERKRRRLKDVVGRISAQQTIAAGGTPDEARRKAIQDKLKEVQQKRSGKNKFDLKASLAMAGLDLSPAQFVLAAMGSAAIVGLIGLAVSPVAGLMGLTAGGIGLPHLLLKRLRKKRLMRFTALFADTLDIIIRGVRSGLPLGECLHMIAHEVPDPVGTEFRMITEGIRIGMTVEDSLERMSERVPTPEVRFFTIVVGIQQQTGGNLAETLAKLSEVLRSRKRMRDKIQAMSSEAKASAGIIGALPVVVSGMLGIVAPEYISLLFTTSAGNWILTGCAVVMSTGVLVMRGMINFEI